MPQFVVIQTGARRQLVPIEDVDEIVPMLQLADMGRQRGACRGAANLRGAIVPVFDLTGPTAPLSPSRYILVTRPAETRVGLIVDDVHHFVALDDARIARCPAGGGHLTRMARVEDDSLLPIIDVQQVVEDAA